MGFLNLFFLSFFLGPKFELLISSDKPSAICTKRGQKYLEKYPKMCFWATCFIDLDALATFQTASRARLGYKRPHIKPRFWMLPSRWSRVLGVENESTIRGAYRGPMVSGIHHISVLPTYRFYMKTVGFSGKGMDNTDAAARKRKTPTSWTKLATSISDAGKPNILPVVEWSFPPPAQLSSSLSPRTRRATSGPQNPPGAAQGACRAADRGPKLSAARMKNLRLAVGALWAQEGFGGMQAGVT